MNVRVYIALFLSGFAIASFAEPAGYGFDYSVRDIPNSSIYQMLYKPQVKEDVPFTSIYSEIYDEGYDGDFDNDSEVPASSFAGLKSDGDFDTEFAGDFSVGKDFLGTARWTGGLNRTGEKPLRCGRGYISERLDPETLTIVRRCAGMDSGLTDPTSGNSFLANSSDGTLRKFGDANSFVSAMAEESRRVDRLRKIRANSRYDDSGPSAMIFSDEMIALLERFSASSPGLQEVIEEAISTGDPRAIYSRIQEAGGLEGLMLEEKMRSSDFDDDDFNY